MTVPVLGAAVLHALVRSAAWRGPVLVDLPTVRWALPLPVGRGGLLLPRFAKAAGLAAAAGAAAGAVPGLLAGTLSPDLGTAGRAWAAAAGAWGGAAVALTAAGCGALVERYDDGRWERRRSRLAAAAASAAVLAGLVLAALATTGRGASPSAGRVLLWSGPWGWSAQPLVAAVDGPAPGWPAALALSVVSTAVVLVAGVRAVPGIPASALRTRATVAERMTASVFSLELRQARLATRGGRAAARSRPLLRLPVPRRRWLLVPWRDATGLLRAPARAVRALVWLAAAVALTALAPAARPTPRAVLAVLALTAAYLAAAHLVEPARLDSDDLRRRAQLPYSSGALALWHAVVPAVLLVPGLAAGAAVAVTAGRGGAGLAVLVGCVPALVGAALVSAYRGVLPPQAVVGTDTPFGNTAVFQLAGWYLRGPLGALATTAPALALVLLHRGPAPAALAGWLAAAGGAQLWWAHHTARRLHRA
ncbi:DUF6297 family protein [Streptomyces mobaraensis]|uniref:DUF6297 family protein n=1 Tax=Streptomyces mobaraensis TaxID=35621 RepID=UPI001CCED8D4|nr:DUF6297 family protein [Streptomyces mobaraensis]UBI35548.1 DUF6297 family protein [Streptomyces mobaraensis]